MNNKFSVTMDDYYGDLVRKMAKKEVRTISNQIFHLVKLGSEGGATKEGEYLIKLSVGELEVIRHVLSACDEFFGFLDNTETVKTSVDFDRLANKVFQQFYDEDGKYR